LLAVFDFENKDDEDEKVCAGCEDSEVDAPHGLKQTAKQR